MRLVVLIFILAGVVVFAGACGFGADADADLYEAEVVELPAPTTPEPVVTPAPVPGPAPTPAPELVAPIEAGTQRLGHEVFGFVDVPADWQKSDDLYMHNIGILHLSDPTETSFIIMYYIIQVPERLMEPEDLINSLASSMEGIGSGDVVIEQVELGGIDALQLRGLLPDFGIATVHYVFEGEHGTLHQVSVTSPFADIMELVYTVEGSFSMLP